MQVSVCKEYSDFIMYSWKLSLDKWRPFGFKNRGLDANMNHKQENQ
ncbi:hypothetical protein LEP1GSC133_0724 [Leptospira borgpetersenii serovar Pomona str. 200901868]|uniref:Uncharacterized protein n=1 Tax=Leptospira borgpetersenii serovar Pomona str. 200901868 TaxID=1192866 RepID=M6VWI6_LEPBO|nr:hypothetical protein LEP1GSC133_0724 [Leptospira borgpetersenii serovar Pomona str. 200901868]